MQEHLGLFDTPPDRRQILTAIAAASILATILLIIMPFRAIRLAEIDAFIPTVSAFMVTGELIIGTMLCAQAAVFRSRALSALSSGYILGALILVPFALAFPGGFAPNGLLGAKVSTAAWLIVFRRLALPAVVVLYIWLKQVDADLPEQDRRTPSALWAVLVAASCVAALTLLAIAGHDWLPSLVVNRVDGVPSNLRIVNGAAAVESTLALILLFRHYRSVLDLWLMVALCSWSLVAIINLDIHARFNVGFYALYGFMLSSDFVVVIALIAESSRLHSRLARSVAAREREVGTRLMSMDAVAAAVAHEIGQPLAAVSLNTTIGLASLDRTPPDTETAAKSLREAKDAGQRAFQVMKSIRTTFKEASELSEFDFNDLVLETTQLLRRDIEAKQIALQLELDEMSPVVEANRVQVQRVLVNVLTNAIESVGATRRQLRQIFLHSTLLDGRQVRLDVANSGASIAPEALERIFEPFFTTKARGTGLGLSLSRTIIEDHGGRLWASTSEGRGATFHLQLPISHVARI